MKFPAFDYARPGTREEALALLAAHGEDAVVLAGGQSLMPILAMRLAAPKLLVDINRLDGLDSVETRNGRLRIGALVRHRRVEQDAAIGEGAGLYAMAAPHVAHPSIRNRGTMGGSLALADPASEFPACVLALAGEIELESARGARRVPAERFFRGIGATAAEPDELLVAVDCPAARAGDRFAFAEIARRHGDFALAGVALAAHVEEDRVTTLRLAFFGVGDRPVLASRAAGILRQGSFGSEAIDAACASLADEIEFAGSVHASDRLRRHLAGVALRRAVAQLEARSVA